MSTPNKDASPVRVLLRLIASHHETIEQALEGVITVHGVPDASIAHLHGQGVLRKAGEDGFRLNPHLRNFLQDHLGLFPAYQTLTEVGSRIGQIRNLWNEIVSTHRPGQPVSAGLIDQMHVTVYDIVDSMDRNLSVISRLMSERFGDVANSAEKASQNNFYQKEVNDLLAGLNRLQKVVDKIENEANELRMRDLARLLRREILDRIATWSATVSELMSDILKSLNELRVIERRMKMLSRMDTLLRQQPSWKGVEVEFADQMPDFLMAAKLATIKPQIDPSDDDGGIRDALVDAAKSLPPRPAPPAPKAPAARIKREASDASPVIDDDVTQALKRIVKEAKSANACADDEEGISLLGWRQDDMQACTVKPSVWLVLASWALQSEGLYVRFSLDPPKHEERFSHTFHDVKVWRHRAHKVHGRSA